MQQSSAASFSQQNHSCYWQSFMVWPEGLVSLFAMLPDVMLHSMPGFPSIMRPSACLALPGRPGEWSTLLTLHLYVAAAAAAALLQLLLYLQSSTAGGATASHCTFQPVSIWQDTHASTSKHNKSS
jgi:hypothetical protein